MAGEHDKEQEEECLQYYGAFFSFVNEGYEEKKEGEEEEDKYVVECSSC